MSFPNHIHGQKRQLLGQQWGKASVVTHEQLRHKNGPDLETITSRRLDDCRGKVVRSGYYSSKGGPVKTWQTRYAISEGSRLDQFELVLGGTISGLPRGPRRIGRHLRPDGLTGWASE